MVIPDIVNSVYKKLLKHDVTARVFSTRDSRDDEDPPVWPVDNSPAIQNRKIFLRWYLTRLNQDPSKKEFVRICLVIDIAPFTDDKYLVGVLGQSWVCHFGYLVTWIFLTPLARCMSAPAAATLSMLTTCSSAYAWATSRTLSPNPF
jgi:hypothetical protein